MGHLTDGILKGAEFYINKNTYGSQVWEQVFKYPDIGFSISYYDYGNDKLGESIGGMLYTDLFFLRNRRWEGLFKLGTGIGYHTNPYNRETNNQNVALGSRFTGSVQLRLGMNYRINDRWKLTSAATLSHFSLAAISQPNKGINIITTNLGCSYRISSSLPEYQDADDTYRWDKRLRYNINFNYSIKEITPIGGPKFPVYVLSLYVNKQVSKTNIFNLGIDGFNNTALKEEIQNDDMDPGTVDHKRIGIMAGHELKLSRVSVLTQIGAYIYRPYKTDQAFYERLAIKLYLSEKLFLHYGFVTHFAKADHAEWGIGIAL